MEEKGYISMNKPKVYERRYFITCAQILSMLLIVLSHALPEDIEVPYWIVAMTPYLQHVGLTVFMFTSGYLMAYTNQLEKYGYVEFIKRRAVRLLFPYFFISILMVIPKYFFAAYAHSQVSLSPVVVIKQIFTPREGILPHLWFLPTLWLLSLLLPLWMQVLKSKRATVFVTIALICLQFIPEITNFLCIDDCIDYAIWLFLGIVVGKMPISKKITSCKFRFAFLAVAVAGGGSYSCLKKHQFFGCVFV